MSETPSRIKQNGREAFVPYENPMDWQPYEKGSWAFDTYYPHWLEGWQTIEKEWELEKEKKRELTALWEDREGKILRLKINACRPDGEISATILELDKDIVFPM